MVEIRNYQERYKLRIAPISDVRAYWESQTVEAQRALEELESIVDATDVKDYELMSALSFKKSYAELIEKAVSLEQYKRATQEYEPVTRIVRIRIDLPRPLIEKYFNLKTISLYGIGLFAPVEGLLLSENFRKTSKYDESLSPLKGAPSFDLSTLPVDIRNEYVFGLTIPAAGDLFVPRKCDMTTNWLYTTRQLEYLELL